MAATGKWLGKFVGKWLGSTDGATTGPNYVDAGIVVSGLGSVSMSPVIDSKHVTNLASLGGFAPAYKKPEELPEEVEIVEEAIPEAYISRIRNEFLSEALAKDLINRAKQRKSRAEEEALLLIL
jgi:hypothetical protein